MRMFRLITLFWCVVFAIGLMGYWHIDRWGNAEIALTTERVVEFPRGTSIATLAGSLEATGLIDNSLMFGIWVRLFGNYGKFQAGNYRFTNSVSPASIADKMAAGKIHQPIVLQFTVPEGFTLKLLFKRLEAKGIASAAEIKKLAYSKTLLKKLNVPSTSLEGFVYPATYSYKRRLSAEEVLTDLVQTFWRKLPSDYGQRVKKMGLTLKNAVTFASLIELETMHADEMPKVSEVIWRRLKAGSPIGIDAALIYGIKDYQGDIKWAHLKDRKNPYNTRIHKGLPPTPIGSPSSQALLAVLNPTNQGYYYYVLNIQSGNRHHFSKTSAEHRKHVKALVKATKKHRRARPK